MYLSVENDRFSLSENNQDEVEVFLFASRDKLGSCIGKQPRAKTYAIVGTDFEAPVFGVTLRNEDITTDSVEWYIDGEAQNCNDLTFTASDLAGKPVGVYRVSCRIEGHDENCFYGERSAEAVFIITAGVIENSVLTFSDVHEEFDKIGDAIGQIMKMNDGCIPSLIVCTGDWVNGSAASDEELENRYFQRMFAQLGGIDTVYVSGNHESAEASALLSISSGLGADESFEDGIGVIFDSRSDGVLKNGKSSLFNNGLIVYGLNYYALEEKDEENSVYTYVEACSQLENFFEGLVKDYNGELVIISSHTGLHVLGMQPESVRSDGSMLREWNGGNQYNLNASYEMAELINRYASEYNIDVMFLFGHDHSGGETEFILMPGMKLISTEDFEGKQTKEQRILFTYGHAGYISSSIGAAKEHYSLIRWDDNSITYELISIEDDSVNKTVIVRPQAENSQNPETGDEGILHILIMVSVTSVFLYMFIKRRTRRSGCI